MWSENMSPDYWSCEGNPLKHIFHSLPYLYRVNDNLQIYLEGKNLTDEPEHYYFGDESRLSQYDEFGTTVVFGARLTY